LKFSAGYGGSQGSASLYWDKAGPVATSYIGRINDKTAQTYTTTNPITNVQDLGDYIYYNVTGLTVGHTYTFQITAVNEVGPGAISDESNSYTIYGTPLTVGMPTVTWGTTTPNGNYGVTVSWTPNTSDPKTTSYNVRFQAIGFGRGVSGPANTSTYTATSMNSADYNGTTYKTIIYGPHNGNCPPVFYNIDVVGLNDGGVQGEGTLNTNNGAGWITY
jgi:hypothetical protein